MNFKSKLKLTSAESILNRSMSLYDGTKKTMGLSNLRSKLRTVSSNITSIQSEASDGDRDATTESKSWKKYVAKVQLGSNKMTSMIHSDPNLQSGSVGKRKHKHRQKKSKENLPKRTFKSAPHPKIKLIDYEVQSRDTLTNVAARFQSTPSEICQINKLVCRSLFPGQYIKLPQTDSDANKFEESPENILKDRTDAELEDAIKLSLQGSIEVSQVRSSDTESTQSDSDDNSCFSSDDSECEASGSQTEELFDPMTAQYMKFSSDYVADIHTMVSGLLLVTTTAFVFSPSSAHTVKPNRFNLFINLPSLRSVAVYKDHSVMYFTLRHRQRSDPSKSSSSISELKSDIPVCSSSFSETAESNCQTDDFEMKEEKNLEGESELFIEEDGKPEIQLKLNSGVTNCLEAETEGSGIQKAQEVFVGGSIDLLEPPLEMNHQGSKGSNDTENLMFEEKIIGTFIQSRESSQFEESEPTAGLIDTKHSSHIGLDIANQSMECTDISTIKEPTQFLCILCTKSGGKKNHRHQTWFTLQSKEYWFRIPESKALALFQFLQTCEFSNDSPMAPGQMSESVSSSVKTEKSLYMESHQSTAGSLIVVADSFDWVLPRIGSMDECSRTMLRMKQKRQAYRLRGERAQEVQNSTLAEGEGECSLDGNSPFIVTNPTVPSFEEERTVLKRLKQESVRWELVSSNELELQDAENRKQQSLLDSLHMSKPEYLPLPRCTNESHVLTPNKVRDLMRNLPAEAEGLDWLLIYSTELHGYSLRSLYHRCSLNMKNLLLVDGTDDPTTSQATSAHSSMTYSCSSKACILAISTTAGDTFGAVLNTHPQLSCGKFYGNGTCYVFRWRGTHLYNLTESAHIGPTSVTKPGSNNLEKYEKSTAISCETSPSVNSLNSIEGVEISEEVSRLLTLEDGGLSSELSISPTGHAELFERFNWTGKNCFFISGDHDYLTIGGSQGYCAMYLDDVFSHGHTERCDTFDNPPLVPLRNFKISNLELWSFQ